MQSGKNDISAFLYAILEWQNVLTDAVVEYKAENPEPPINEELYMEHDADIMNMIIEFLNE